MLNQNSIFKTDIPPSPAKAEIASAPGITMPMDKPSSDALYAEDTMLRASFEEYMLSASNDHTNVQDSFEESDLLVAPVDVPENEPVQPQPPLLQSNSVTAPNMELAISAPDNIPDIATPPSTNEFSNNAVSVTAHDREITPARDITIARPPASTTPTPTPWSNSFVDDNRPALEPSHKPTPPTDLPLVAIKAEDARIITDELNITPQRGDGARLPAEAATPQTVTPSEDIDVKLADQRLIEMRHIAGQNSTADAVIKTPAISSAITTSPLAATQMSTAEAASFTIAALPSSPLSTASPLALSSPLTPLNAPSFQSVTQSIIKTVETQKGVSVRLDPPEMGRVYIDYQFDADKSVTAIVRTDLPEALAQLRENGSFLQNLLKDNGFENVNIDFAQSGSDREESSSEDFQEHRLTLNSESAVEGFTPSPTSTSSPNLQRQYLNQSIDIKL